MEKMRSPLRRVYRVLFILCLLMMGSLLLAQTELQLSREDALQGQCYGFNLDLYENSAMIGAYHDDPTWEDKCNGSVYFNNFNGESWEQVQKIEYQNELPMQDAGFGYDLAFNDTTALIACPWDYTGYTLTGAVHYYYKSGDEWVFGQQLKPSNEGGFDDFGLSLDFDDDLMIVGAPGTDEVLETQIPDEMNFGAAYIFRWNGTEWLEEQMLMASDGSSFDSFGSRVSIQGDVAVVTATNGGVDDMHTAGPGQAYVFRYNGTTWVEEQILTADDGENGAWFGRSVILKDNMVVVGAVRSDNIEGSIYGAAYVYEWNETEWEQVQKLVPPIATSSNFFGNDIDIYENRMVIGGAYWGAPADGTIFVYDNNGTEWESVQKITHSNPSAAGDDFGNGVAIYGDRIMGGAPWRDTDTSIFSGSAYVYHYEDMAPVADSGVDGEVIEGNVYSFDGSASFDYEGVEITYLWSAPEGITLSDITSVNPSFTAPTISEASIELVFSLVVNDGELDSLPNEVIITVRNDNAIPVANAGQDAEMMEETDLTLDGSASSDPDNATITYLWSAPEGITLSDPTIVNPSFTAPEVAEETILAFTLTVNDGEFDSETDDILITVLPILPIAGLQFDEENSLIKWTAPGAVTAEFRYDDGTMTGQLGANNETSMLGSAHYYNAIVEEVSWFVTSEGGPHHTVTVAVLGLDGQGIPDLNQIYYLNESAPNNDDSWTTLTLPEPIEAPNGFYVGLLYPGFLGIGMDDGIVAPYEFTPGTHWMAMDWINGGWDNPENYDFPNNFMIRANGLSFGELDSRDVAYSPEFNPEFRDNFRSSELAEPMVTETFNNERFFTNSYNIYLGDTMIEYGYEGTEYPLTSLGSGTHTIGIAALYDEGESDLVEITFDYDDGTSAENSVVKATSLIGNYPNPFNPNTAISFNLKTAGNVELSIYNIKGQKVTTLLHENLLAGAHLVEWNGTDENGQNSASGIYFYRLHTSRYTSTKKMILMK